MDYIEVRDWGGDFERWGRVIEGASMEPELLEGRGITVTTEFAHGMRIRDRS